jgi:uncharacterized RDD family membrane protein YckC
VEYEDRVRIDTAEGVALELTLAGVGSRFVAALLDNMIEAVVVGAAALIVYVAGAGGGFGVALLTIVVFAVLFGYDILFEVLNGGRTPGKKRVGIRVVRTGGEPITFFPSAVRNLLRLVDILPIAYLIGTISILVTKRNQRIGDLVAGTIIVRERGRKDLPSPPQRVAAPPPAWDVSAVTRDELMAIRAFLDRRSALTDAARADLARTLAAGLRRKVAGATNELGDERFLEQVAAARSARD